MKNFALIGVAGFVAPRHLEAIRATGNNLVAATDLSDSVGVLDRFFPQAQFFTAFDQFRKYLQIRSAEHKAVDYLSVCTPNHLHEQHVRFGLENGIPVICEKPLVLTPREAEALLRLQESSGVPVYNLLQLRLHPAVTALGKRAATISNRKPLINLTYITPRGAWYHNSWKGDEQRSGGIATNIGIHFFDMLLTLFGTVQHIEVHLYGPDRAAGYLELEKARVRWFLSIQQEDLPPGTAAHAFRELTLDDERVDFSEGFTDLHTKSYESILDGSGFGLAEALPSIELAYRIRNSVVVPGSGEMHPMVSIVKH